MVEFVELPGKCPERVRGGWHSRSTGTIAVSMSHPGNTRKSDIQHLSNEHLVWCVPGTMLVTEDTLWILWLSH